MTPSVEERFKFFLVLILDNKDVFVFEVSVLDNSLFGEGEGAVTG